MLQGDCLSPLLFNLCINSFIRTLQTSEFAQLSYKSSKLLKPWNWLEFADDALALSATESENPIVVNAQFACTILFDTILYYLILFDTILYYLILFDSILCYSILFYIIRYY